MEGAPAQYSLFQEVTENTEARRLRSEMPFPMSTIFPSRADRV